MKQAFLFSLLALLSVSTKSMAVVTLAFDASITPNVGYVLKWGTNSAGVIGSMALDTNRVVKLSDGPWGAFYFKVTAFNNSGVESDPSNVLLATNRPAAPLNLRMVPDTNSITLQGSEDLQTWQTIAIVPKTGPPVMLAAQPRQMFRASSIVPPMPGFTAASAQATLTSTMRHKQRGVR